MHLGDKKYTQNQFLGDLMLSGARLSTKHLFRLMDLMHSEGSPLADSMPLVALNSNNNSNKLDSVILAVDSRHQNQCCHLLRYLRPQQRREQRKRRFWQQLLQNCHLSLRISMPSMNYPHHPHCTMDMVKEDIPLLVCHTVRITVQDLSILLTHRLVLLIPLEQEVHQVMVAQLAIPSGARCLLLLNFKMDFILV